MVYLEKYCVVGGTLDMARSEKFYISPTHEATDILY